MTLGDDRVAEPAEVLADLLARMPDPASAAHADALEAGLASWLGSRHAIVVSSGTAALHTALAVLGVGSGDEVLIPALSVVMSAAPITYTGARPVFVDCTPSGEIDHDDLTAKRTAATRAVLPVHLWGRATDTHWLADFAVRHGLHVIEDACQAFGTIADGRRAGTFGEIGCFSMKDGKILSCGEGGFLIADDASHDSAARAFRTHWQRPPRGQPAMARIGFNYRLAEPLAALARCNLGHVDHLLAQRAHQSALFTSLLADTPGLEIPQNTGEGWNAHSPLISLTLSRSRAFCVQLAASGVPNSVGTFGLIPASQQPAFSGYEPAACPNAARLIDTTLAVIVTARDDDDRIRRYADIIDREARRWPAH